MNTILVVFFGLVFAMLSNAQSTTTTPTFEVASVKEITLTKSPQMQGGPGTANPLRFTATGNLVGFITKAWGISKYEVSGSADSSKFYEILANIPEGATAQDFKLMLQSLLVERFSLVTHREERELSVLNLVVAKDGPKLKAAEPDLLSVVAVNGNKVQSEAPSPHDLPLEMVAAKTPGGMSQFGGKNKPVSALALFLELPLHKKVVDKTGLAGSYDFTLELNPAEIFPPIPGHEFAIPSGQPAASPGFPTITQALADLGLKLEQAKIKAPVLVIDSYQKTPTSN